MEMKSVVVTGWNKKMCMKDFDVINSSSSVLVINPFTEIPFSFSQLFRNLSCLSFLAMRNLPSNSKQESRSEL
jgi:hypothetical protein